MFRSVEIRKEAIGKIQGESAELFKSDVEGALKSFSPGEWILLRNPYERQVFLAFANPFVADQLPAIQVLTRLKSPPTENLVEDYLDHCLEKAWRSRSSFQDYQRGCRVIYGQADGLPGLIVDLYRDCALIQINTAGMEKWRALLREKLQRLLAKPCYYFDNSTLRSREVLPHHHESLPLEFLHVEENDFRYEIPCARLQKIGWYYDHRENRRKFEAALTRWQGSREKGLDLFCYAGAWGLHALRAQVQKLTFVDQAPLGELIERHLELNGMKGRGNFERADVFDWLEAAEKGQERYDVIISDPPAFAKSPSEKAAALDGYKKLHRRVLKVCRPDGLIAFASCTYYVGLADFWASITQAAKLEGRRIQILEQGMQGWDHPVRHEHDKSNYIKYILVKVES